MNNNPYPSTIAWATRTYHKCNGLHEHVLHQFGPAIAMCADDAWCAAYFTTLCRSICISAPLVPCQRCKPMVSAAVVYDMNGREASDVEPVLAAVGDVEQYIFCSSAGVYLKSDQMPHREEDSTDPKSRHKVCYASPACQHTARRVVVAHLRLTQCCQSNADRLSLPETGFSQINNMQLQDVFTCHHASACLPVCLPACLSVCLSGMELNHKSCFTC